MHRPILVQKYGGSSVSSAERIQAVADAVVQKQAAGYAMVVVVSAMGDATDALLARAKAISQEPSRRELDMLLSVGERISMSLLALAIQERGQDAVSLTGSQSGIITSGHHSQARIMEVRPFRVQDELAAGRIVIVAGYQGVSYKREITTLGRGGSDTTAVALAAALQAEACEIYSDVSGVFTADPRVITDATCIPVLSYPEMQELAEAGAKVLAATAVEFAKNAQIAIYARQTGSSHPGSVIRLNAPPPPSGIRGIAHQSAIQRLSGALPAEALGDLMAQLEASKLSAREIRFGDGQVSMLFPPSEFHAEGHLASVLRPWFAPSAFTAGLGSVALIGPGMTERPDLIYQALQCLSLNDIPVLQLSTSSFRISLLVPGEATEKALEALHHSFGLHLNPQEAKLE